MDQFCYKVSQILCREEDRSRGSALYTSSIAGSKRLSNGFKEAEEARLLWQEKWQNRGGKNGTNVAEPGVITGDFSQSHSMLLQQQENQIRGENSRA